MSIRLDSSQIGKTSVIQSLQVVSLSAGQHAPQPFRRPWPWLTRNIVILNSTRSVFADRAMLSAAASRPSICAPDRGRFGSPAGLRLGFY
jgi:hypothetical protein